MVRRGGWVVGLAVAVAGCGVGPRALHSDRLAYNEAVKVTSEEQLLLNIVRLRYCDTPSSLSVTSVADQRELVRNLGVTPFFTSAAAGQALGGYRGAVLPQAGVTAATRPTLTYTPDDDGEFTRRLFTPISLDAVEALAKTTWPIDTVFRLWLENLNWVSNAETASGPTPRDPPEFAAFREGVEALQRLTDRKRATLYLEETDDPVGDELPAAKVTARAVVEAAKGGFEYRKRDDGTWQVVRKKNRPVLRVADDARADPDFHLFCRVFKLDPGQTSFLLTVGKLDPFLKGTPAGGLAQLDLETRSLLQVLFYVAHGVEVPAEHAASGAAPQAWEADGRAFDWAPVLGGLFKVCHAAGKKPPASAHVAVRYQGFWFYIDERDRDTKATFALLLELSRLQVSPDKGDAGPTLTLPVGR